MPRIKAFDLAVTLRLLDELTLERVEPLSFDDLQWILANFTLSWGQQLYLDPAAWPPAEVRAEFHRFGERYLPFSTASDFTHVASRQVKMLALGVTSHALFILLLDEIIDAPKTASAAFKLILQHLLAHSYKWYGALFPPESLFWKTAEEHARTTTLAMWREYADHNSCVQPFSLPKFKNIGMDKVAVGQINAIGLAVLNGTAHLIPQLKECWDTIGLAATVLDDVHDWKIDYRSGNYTYLLSQVLLSPPFRADVEAGQLPPVEEVGAAILLSEIPESLHDLACAELDAATEKAMAIGCPALAGLTRQLSARLRHERDELIRGKLASLLMLGTKE